MSRGTTLSGATTTKSVLLKIFNFWIQLRQVQMKLAPQTLYHLYNRGNNKQDIFFQERNYDFFKQKAFQELGSQVDILAYCLMPNHFHFLISTKVTLDGTKLSDSLRTLLSSYTRAIQKQERITGSLFQQNSKFKELVSNEYASTCFHYIHQNPLRAGLAVKLEDWPHQSFKEYWENRPGICNVALGKQLMTIPTETNQFYNESYKQIPDQIILNLF